MIMFSSVTCYSLSTMCPSRMPESLVLCLGNFDGVHMAHRELMKTAITMRNTSYSNAACGVFCFTRSPSHYLKENSPGLLSTTRQKLELFAACGMEYAVLVPFEDICNLTPEEFIGDFLVQVCHTVGAVCGFNYRFGKERKGDVTFLRRHADFEVAICDAVLMEGEPISSTRIRSLLKEGCIREANLRLMRPYSFTSPVLHGKTLGRRLGAPTVNQCFPEGMMIPRHGVYVTSCTVEGKSYRAVSNVGLRPTVDSDDRVNCESYLLDFSGDLYDREITVSFLDFIRPEKRFEDMDELQKQIQKDIQHAKDYR